MRERLSLGTCEPSRASTDASTRCEGALTTTAAMSPIARPARFKASPAARSISGTWCSATQRSSHVVVPTSPSLRQRSITGDDTDAVAAISAQASGPKANAAAASPPLTSSSEPGRPQRMSESTVSDGSASEAAALSAEKPERTRSADVVRAGVIGEPNRHGDRGGVALVHQRGWLVANQHEAGQPPWSPSR